MNMLGTWGKLSLCCSKGRRYGSNNDSPARVRVLSQQSTLSGKSSSAVQLSKLTSRGTSSAVAGSSSSTETVRVRRRTSSSSRCFCEVVVRTRAAGLRLAVAAMISSFHLRTVLLHNNPYIMPLPSCLQIFPQPFPSLISLYLCAPSLHLIVFLAHTFLSPSFLLRSR